MALAEASPETVGTYRQVCAASTKEAHLDAKTRELISLAVAVTTRSDGCIAAHTKAAIDLGATREEVAGSAERSHRDEHWRRGRLFRTRHGCLHSFFNQGLIDGMAAV